MDDVSKAAAILGRKGGLVSSPKKAEAVRRNGALSNMRFCCFCRKMFKFGPQDVSNSKHNAHKACFVAAHGNNAFKRNLIEEA